MNKEDKHYRQNSERIQHKHNTPATRCAGCHDHNEEELILDPESQLLYHRGCKEEFLGHAMDEQILPQKKKSKIKGAIAGAVLGLVGLVGAYALTTSETQQQQPEVVQAAPSSLSIDFIGNYKHLEATVHPVVVGNDGTIMVKDSVAEITKDNQNLELAQGLYVIKGTVDHEFNFQKPMKLEEGSSLESRLILPAKNIEGFMPVSYTMNKERRN